MSKNIANIPKRRVLHEQRRLNSDRGVKRRKTYRRKRQGQTVTDGAFPPQNPKKKKKKKKRKKTKEERRGKLLQGGGERSGYEGFMLIAETGHGSKAIFYLWVASTLGQEVRALVLEGGIEVGE